MKLPNKNYKIAHLNMLKDLTYEWATCIYKKR